MPFNHYLPLASLQKPPNSSPSYPGSPFWHVHDDADPAGRGYGNHHRQQRTADDDNPKAITSSSVSKDERRRCELDEEAGGKVIKVISACWSTCQGFKLQSHLMHRKMDEILAPRSRCWCGVGSRPIKPATAPWRPVFPPPAEVEAWLAAQQNMQVLYIQYDELLAEPHAHIAALVNSWTALDCRRWNAFRTRTSTASEMTRNLRS